MTKISLLVLVLIWTVSNFLIIRAVRFDPEQFTISLVGPYTSDHGYLQVRETSPTIGDPLPVCELNRFAATLLCSHLYQGEGRTLTWFGYTLKTAYYPPPTTSTSCYVIKCRSGYKDLNDCDIEEVERRQQVAYIKCMTEYENSYCQLDDVHVVDQCDFFDVTPIPYWSDFRILIYTLTSTLTVGIVFAFIVWSPYQNPALLMDEE